jgi:hypothetical protein
MDLTNQQHIENGDNANDQSEVATQDSTHAIVDTESRIYDDLVEENESHGDIAGGIAATNENIERESVNNTNGEDAFRGAVGLSTVDSQIDRDVEHNYHKYIHIRDDINNKFRSQNVNKQNIIHILLSIMERVKDIDLSQSRKNELSLYIFKKLAEKYNIYTNEEMVMVMDVLPQVIDQLCALRKEKMFSKTKIVNVMEPNLITYTVYEQFDRHSVFAPITLAFSVLDEVYRYNCLKKDEKITTTLKIMNMLYKNYNYSSTNIIAEILIPDIIDCVIAIYENEYVIKHEEIQEVEIKKNKKWWMCCS